MTKGVRNETQQRQVMHTGVVQHTLTDAQNSPSSSEGLLASFPPCLCLSHCSVVCSVPWGAGLSPAPSQPLYTWLLAGHGKLENLSLRAGSTQQQ